MDSDPKSTNAQIENCNSPSSDDEVFQECENTFDGTPNAKIVAESGYRTANYSNDTFDATINFPAHIANSTTTSAAANLSDRFAILSQKSSGFSSLLDVTRNVSENGQTIESMPETDNSVGTLDRTIQSNIDSVESSGTSMNSLDAVRQEDADLPSSTLDSANATLKIESDDDRSANDVILVENVDEERGFMCVPDVLHGTATVSEPPNEIEAHDEAQPEHVSLVQSVENVAGIATISLEINSEEVSPFPAIDQHSYDSHIEAAEPPIGPETPEQSEASKAPETAANESHQINDASESSTVDDHNSTETGLNETQNAIEATVLGSLPAALRTETEEPKELAEVAKPAGIFSANATNVQIESDANEPMDVSMGINDTFSEPMDVSMAVEPSAQVFEEATQLSPSSSLLNETHLLSSPATIAQQTPDEATQSPPSTLLDETHLFAGPAIITPLNEAFSLTANETVSMPANENSFEPNATIILNANIEKITEEARVLSDATFCAPARAEQKVRPSANLNETILVESKLPNPSTTFFAQRSIDVVDETLNHTTSPANEATFQVEPQFKRISFGIDANAASPASVDDLPIDLTETSPSVNNDDDDVFKVPCAPMSSSGFGEQKLSSQKTFDISDDEFQSGGSKSYFRLFLFISELNIFFMVSTHDIHPFAEATNRNYLVF